MEVPRKVDRLSSLPVELLSFIFDLARRSYSDRSPIAPLSKSLRPFYEREIYNDPCLSHDGKSSRFRKFASAIEAEPSRGQHVTRLSLSYGKEEEGVTVQEFEEKCRVLFPFLTRVAHLWFDYPCVKAFRSAVTAGNVFSRLQLMSFPAAEEGTAVLKVEEEFAWLSNVACLPSLNDLELEWRPFSVVYPAAPNLLPWVKSIHFSSGTAAESSVLALINSCPSLDSVMFTAVSGEIEFDEILQRLPTSLTSLGAYQYCECPEPVDHLVSRFTSLKHLGLGDDLYSEDVASRLLSLPHLESLFLEAARHDVNKVEVLRNIVQLLPSIETLKRLTLQFGYAGIGPRFDPDKPLTVNLGHYLHWSLPNWREGEAIETKRLVQAAVRAGIKVDKDDVVYMIETHEAYLLERYNRAVAEGTTTKDFSEVENVREEASRFDFPLPSLDIGSLDLDRLEYVKTPLPQQDWFILSLKNREE